MFFFPFLLELLKHSRDDRECLERVAAVITLYLDHFFQKEDVSFQFYIKNHFVVSLRDMFVLANKRHFINARKCVQISRVLFFILFEKNAMTVEELCELREFSAGEADQSCS